jgi:hypothetical protein
MGVAVARMELGRLGRHVVGVPLVGVLQGCALLVLVAVLVHRSTRSFRI